MSCKPYVEMEEAQESDLEENTDVFPSSKDSVEICKGKIVYGEAPESDEESYTNTGSLESVSSAVSALSAPRINEKKKSLKHQSILTEKLCDKNISLHKNIMKIIEQTATNAGNELNATNRRLLKCQLQMQEGADHLKLLNSSLAAIEFNFHLLLSTQFLPNMKIYDS